MGPAIPINTLGNSARQSKKWEAKEHRNLTCQITPVVSLRVTYTSLQNEAKHSVNNARSTASTLLNKFSYIGRSYGFARKDLQEDASSS